MGYAIEAGVLLLLGWAACRTWRRGAGRAAHALAGTLLALVVALTVAWTADLAARGLDNLVTRAGLLTGMAMTTVALVRWRWWRDPGRRERWSVALAARPRLAATALAAVIALPLAVTLLLATVAINLAVRRWPEAGPALRGRTILARCLLVDDPLAQPPPATDADQRRLIAGLGALFASGREAAAEATGMRAALDAIDVLRELGALDPAGKLWLARNQPALARVIDHPGLAALASDPAVVDEIARVARGNLAAAWRLGDRADVQALFADPDIAAAIAGIHLGELRAAWRERTAHGPPVALAWRLEVPGSPIADGEAGAESMRCAPEAGPLRAFATVVDADPGRYRLRLSGLAAPRVLLDGRPCALVGGAGDLVAELALAEARAHELRVEAAAAPDGRIGLALSRCAER